MTKTGRLAIENEESRLDGTLLARRGAPDPLGAATSFLRNLGLRDGDCITVSGDSGTIGSVSVIFIQSASKADESLCVGTPATAEVMALHSAPIKGLPLKESKTKSSKKKATPKVRKAVKKTPKKAVQRRKSKGKQSRRRR